MATLHDIGELGAIERICEQLPGWADVVVGPGDDCAVVRPSGAGGNDWLLTSDPVIEGIHFDVNASRSGVGHKAVGRVLSDIAAMGGKPAWALIDIAAPGSTTVEELDQLRNGALELAARHRLAIVGGDVSEAPVLELHVFAVGTVPSGRAILRSGAATGDIVCVTGSLGGSAAGRHLCFEPRLVEGAWLGDWATAMIDLSDGLASDLRRLAGMSGAGCELETRLIPVAQAARKMRDGISPLDHALHDGEDFELLFTLPREREDAFFDAWQNTFKTPCARIGKMTAVNDEILLKPPEGPAKPLEGTGFAHFQKRRRVNHAQKGELTDIAPRRS